LEAAFFLGADFEEALTCFERIFSFLYSLSEEIEEYELRGEYSLEFLDLIV